ncbi:MAG: hypothetical protein QOD47_125 [Gemmatimonadaceae bacterium]|nr:hypothetical protein [Gemmatimonadaceae bacterium]
MQPSQIFHRHYAFVLAAVAIACSAPDSVNSPTALTELQLDAARPTDPGYTVIELPTFPGDRESFAVEVNDAGTVVGYGIGPTFPRGFVLTATSSTPIPLGDAASWSRGLAISSGSNGSPLYVVGDYASVTENSHATRWTVDPITQSATGTSLSTQSGNANGVNDAGKAVGTSGSDAVIWDLDGTATTIAPPDATFTNGVGRDINNADHGVFNFSGPSYTRTYFRNADGRMLELPPLSGDVSTYGRRVSEVFGNTVYVAGTSFLNDNSFHAMRWTIDVTTNSIVNTENRAETSSSSDVSTGGSMSGSVTGRQKNTPFLWRLTGLLTLNLPKGGGSADASGISDNGKYLVGQASIRQQRRAVLWTFASP